MDFLRSLNFVFETMDKEVNIHPIRIFSRHISPDLFFCTILWVGQTLRIHTDKVVRARELNFSGFSCSCVNIEWCKFFKDIRGSPWNFPNFWFIWLEVTHLHFLLLHYIILVNPLLHNEEVLSFDYQKQYLSL